MYCCRRSIWVETALCGAFLMLWTVLAGGETAAAPHGRWSAEEAQAWYGKQAWIMGANFVPSTASNELEMWQAKTFDAATIDRELGWAADAGYNAMRVFLHDMLWKADAAGFAKRMEEYLAIADKHGIRTLFVLFDSCWNPRPVLGPQAEPVPGLHNSRWVQSPHIDVLKDPAQYDSLKPYVTEVLSHFKDDARVLGWDLLNEPGNVNTNYGEGWSPADKEKAHVALLTKIFAWAQEVRPSQPLTAGLWVNVGGRTKPVAAIDQLMLDQSDVITFHAYGKRAGMQKAVDWLKPTGRPIICTEFMARGAGSTFQDNLPYLKEANVGAMNWGLVSGRSQTIYAWDTWKKAATSEPNPWFHDVFRKDGTPYDPAEINLIQTLSGRPAK